MTVSGNRAAALFVLLEVFVTSGLVFIPYRSVSLAGSSVTILIIVFIFSIFLVAGAKSGAGTGRKAGTVIVFIIANISVIIVIYGNMYKWLGVRDLSCGDIVHYDLLNGLLFSVATWTTLGLGDLMASLDARFVAVAEALTGYLVMGLLIAALSSLVQQRR